MIKIVQATEAELLELLRRAVREELVANHKLAAEITPEPKPANKAEAAEFLRISPATLDKLVRSGELKAFYIGAQVRFHWKDLREYGMN